MLRLFLKKMTQQKQTIIDQGVLLGVSKVFERLKHEQISFNIDHFLFPYMCGYRKDYSTQHAFLSFIEE